MTGDLPPSSSVTVARCFAAAAKHLATVTLELGGKSPVIVDAGADIAKVAADLASAKQFNGGQACISPDYVFVKEEQQAALVAGFRETVAAGGTFDADNLTVHPTMLTGVTPQMKILQEEIFAPVIPVMTYDKLDQVIGYIEARDKPLALYIYSDNNDTIDTVLARTSSGGVTVNGVFSHYLENQLPFGGVNQSGMGSYHGYFGFKAFSHERAVYRHR